MYAVWVKIDQTLPWIELKGTYQTKKEAKKAAKETLNHAEMRIVKMPGQGKLTKTLAATKTR